MERTDDLATRWPQFDLVRRATWLKSSFHCTPVVFESGDAGRAWRVAVALRDKDPSAWTSDPSVQLKIANRLGWMTSPELMAQSIDRLVAFGKGVKASGITHVVLLGMGGSSLAPEVLRAILGSAPGYPVLHVLDSTDPAAVLAAHTPIETTLYILASKSGTTIEPNSLAAHFRARLEEALVPRWADHFIAITDEGTELHAQARAEQFRDVFINPSDIGGRYSALSFFGLVPAAIMGQNIAELIAWGMAMLVAAKEPDVAGNPAVVPGLLMGTGAKAGRDKLTLLLPSDLMPFGLWVEQLVAESIGKNGVGIVPIVDEPNPVNRPDRVFAALGGFEARFVLDTPDGEEQDGDRVPIAGFAFREKEALGAEFVRWEIATAIAGALLEINPFDEPNVQQAKDATRVLLDRYKAERQLPIAAPDATTAVGATLTLSHAARTALQNRASPAPSANPEAFLSLVRQGDYVAILAYVGPDPALLAAFQEFRTAVFERTGVATTFGYGPRYLHSTGQLHKGGPNNGVFIMVTATPATDLPIPGEAYSFGTLESAQALGDFSALEAAGRRALHIHVPAPHAPALRNVLTPLLAALS
jgi:glucose-6-phosphate isomerase